MGKLGNISGRDAAKAFQKEGWEPLGQVGSHLVMIKPGIRVNLSIPQHKELSVRNTARIDTKCRADRRRISQAALVCRLDS